MNKANRSLLNLICSISSKLILIPLAFLIPRITLVSYGSEVNGLLNSVNQFIIYLGLFEAGVQAAARQNLYLPVSINDKDKINAILAAVNVSYKKTGALYFGGLFLMSVGYAIFVPMTTESALTVFAVVLFSGLPNAMGFFYHAKYRILLQAEGKNYIIVNLQTIVSVLNNIVKIVLLSMGANVAIVLMASFVVSLVQLLYIVFYIKRKYSWIDLSVTPDYSALSQKNSVLIHVIAEMIFQHTDVVILTLFCDLKVVSVYSIYKLIVQNISLLLEMVFSSSSFIFGQLFNTNVEKFKKLMDMVEVYFGALLFAVYTVVLFLLLPFIRMYTSGATDINYVDIRLVYLFIVIELLTYMRYPLLNVISYYAGHFKQTVPQTIAEALINAVVSIIGVHYFGIFGVLIGTVLALAYRSFDIIIYANKKIYKRSPIKTLSIYFVDILIFIIAVIISLNVKFEIYTIGQFLVAGCVLTPISLVVYMLAQSLIHFDSFKYALSLLKSKTIKREKNYE